MTPDCSPCAGASRLAIKRPVGRKVILDMKGLKFSDRSTRTPTMGKQSQIIYFSGGHWIAGFRALPKTAGGCNLPIHL
jgi:hypothetical protein